MHDIFLFFNQGGWGSYSDVQTHHLGIPLTPRRFGISSEYQEEIWKAANATKSNVIMMWWRPDALYNSFLGSEAQFLKVTLPTPTQECIDNRIERGAQCEENFSVERTSPLGVCDYPPTLLTTYTSAGLQNDPLLSDGIHSPAFDALTRFRISEHQIAQWSQIKSRSKSPREAICSWAVENIDYLEKLVPETFPRILTKQQYSPFSYATITFSGIVILCAIGIGVKVYVQRDERVIKAAQIEFLYILLLGSILMAGSALCAGLPTSDAACRTQIWLVNLGFSLQIVPLLVKVAAINRLMKSGKKFRRVLVTRKSLYQTVAWIIAGMMVFLTLWTTIGDPRKFPIYSLNSPGTASDDESVVVVEYVCRTDSPMWRLLSFTWATIVLFCGTILAGQMRNMQSEFNEFQTLWILVFSHFLIVVCIWITFTLPKYHDNIWRQTRSLLYGIDALLALCIYFKPKLFRGEAAKDRSDVSGHLSRRTSRRESFVPGDFIVDSTEGQLTLAALRAIIAQKDEEIAALLTSSNTTSMQTSMDETPPSSCMHYDNDDRSSVEFSLGDEEMGVFAEHEDMTIESLRATFHRNQKAEAEERTVDDAGKPLDDESSQPSDTDTRNESPPCSIT
jgi:hypothetical protein